MKEGDPEESINPYGYSKLVVERMLKDAETAYGIRHVSLRYFNSPPARFPMASLRSARAETHLIPLVTLAAMGRKPFVAIFGDRTSDT